MRRCSAISCQQAYNGRGLGSDGRGEPIVAAGDSDLALCHRIWHRLHRWAGFFSTHTLRVVVEMADAYLVCVFCRAVRRSSAVARVPARLAMAAAGSRPGILADNRRYIWHDD